MKKIAVTLSNGKLGTELIKLLIPKVGKENLVGIARTPSKSAHLGIEVRKGDYNSFEDFDIALQSIDVLLVISGIDPPEKRIEQHRNIIKAAKNNKVKKIVYTSVIGDENTTTFSAIIKSNRQTEQDIMDSGISWCICRNSLYIEPDLDYLETYKALGAVINSAGNGKCTYTSRKELAIAYANILTEDKHNDKIYNLTGPATTQSELVLTLNKVFNTNLIYKSISVSDYLEDRKAELGDFLGTIISSIYENIRNGKFDVASDFKSITGRHHKSILEVIEQFKKDNYDITD